MDINAKIKAAITASPLKQKQIAEAVGCSESFISSIINKGQRPGTYYLDFCRVLKLDPATADPRPDEKPKSKRKTIRAHIEPPDPLVKEPPVFRYDFPEEAMVTRAEYLQIMAQRDEYAPDINRRIDSCLNQLRSAYLELTDDEPETREELRQIGEMLKTAIKHRELRLKLRG